MPGFTSAGNPRNTTTTTTPGLSAGDSGKRARTEHQPSTAHPQGSQPQAPWGYPENLTPDRKAKPGTG